MENTLFVHAENKPIRRKCTQSDVRIDWRDLIETILPLTNQRYKTTTGTPNKLQYLFATEGYFPDFTV